MNDLGTILDGLEPLSESYVWERSRNPNNSIESILKKIGTSKTKFYTQYDADERARLDDLALRLARDTNYKALRKASEYAAVAMATLVQLMHSAESEQVKLNASKALLEYALGKPTARVDVTSNGERLQMYGNVSPDDWDDDDD